MRKTIFQLSIYFTTLPLLILSLILYSLYLLHQDGNNLSKNLDILNKGVYYKAIPEASQKTIISFPSEDGRVSVLKEFFTTYKSPLIDHAEKIVSSADQYNIDYRLIPAIAMQESNLCKKIPKDSYNCWGFGIYGKKVTRFENYDKAIETVTKTLAKEYKQKGLSEPTEIMTKYTPSSNGSWAQGVTFFMDKIHFSL